MNQMHSSNNYMATYDVCGFAFQANNWVWFVLFCSVLLAVQRKAELTQQLISDMYIPKTAFFCSFFLLAVFLHEIYVMIVIRCSTTRDIATF